MSKPIVWDDRLWADDEKLLKACEDELPPDEEFGLPDDKYWYDDAEAVRAARDDGQWVPLAHRLLWHEPLSDEARQLIASKLLNTHKKHGATEADRCTTGGGDTDA